MKKSAVLALVLVLCSVALGLISAWLLKEASLKQSLGLSSLVLLIGFVAAVNASRFLLWGYIHKYYPLSFSYPITSLFFPLILIMGYFYGDSIGFMQIMGVVFISSGVIMLTYEGSED